MAPDITILGLGPAGLNLLTQASREALTAGPRLILRTEHHPAAAQLREQGVAFESLDAHLTLENGDLRLDPLDFGFAGGHFEGSVHLDARQDPMQGERRVQPGEQRLDHGNVGRHPCARPVYPRTG